jgi:hypothetical protein
MLQNTKTKGGANWQPSDAALIRIIDAVATTPKGRRRRRLVDCIKRDALAGDLMLAWSDWFARDNLASWSSNVFQEVRDVAGHADKLQRGLRSDAARKLFWADADKLEWLASAARLATVPAIRLRQTEIIITVLGPVYQKHVGKVGISNSDAGDNPFVRFVIAVAREWQISPLPTRSSIVWALRAAKKKRVRNSRSISSRAHY